MLSGLVSKALSLLGTVGTWLALDQAVGVLASGLGLDSNQTAQLTSNAQAMFGETGYFEVTEENVTALLSTISFAPAVSAEGDRAAGPQSVGGAQIMVPGVDVQDGWFSDSARVDSTAIPEVLRTLQRLGVNAFAGGGGLDDVVAFILQMKICVALPADQLRLVAELSNR